MSNATKCDRCGACYEYGGMTVGEEYDLCDGCIADFEAWVNAGMHGERVTESPEMSHDTREKLEADVRRKQREWSQSPCALDTNVHEVIGWLDRQAAITEREVKLRELHKFEENHRWHVRSIEEVNQQLNERIAELRAKLDAEAQHAREAWRLWGEADVELERMTAERYQWKDAYEDSEHMRLELIEQVRRLQDVAAGDRLNA